jgi:hypothetical protein
MIRLLKTMLTIGLIGSLLALAGGGWFYWRVSTPLPLAGERVEFHVSLGSGMRVLARDIVAGGIDLKEKTAAMMETAKEHFEDIVAEAVEARENEKKAEAAPRSKAKAKTAGAKA